MPQLEPLNLKITGNAAGLSAALGRAQNDVKGFDGKVGGLLGGFNSLKSAVIGNPISSAAIAGVAALTAAAASAAVALGRIKEQLNEVDAAAKVADKIGIKFTELQGLRFSLAETAGLDQGTIDNALQKLQIGLGEAAEKGGGKVFDTLAKIGLNAGELLRAGPVEALKQISERTQALQTPTDQLLVAYELFGKKGAGLVTTLRSGRDALEESYGFAAQWLGVSEEQSALVQTFNDKWNRVETVIKGVVQLAAVELAPIMLELTESILATADGAKSFGDYMRIAANTTAVLVGEMRDLLELLAAQVTITEKLARFDFLGALEDLNTALTFDNGEKFLAAVEERRRKFAELATERPPLVSDEEIENLEKAATKLEQISKIAAPSALQFGTQAARGAEIAFRLGTPSQSSASAQQAALLAKQEQIRADAAKEAERQKQADESLNAEVKKSYGKLVAILNALENQSEPTPVNL
jgi:hypothetical protein